MELLIYFKLLQHCRFSKDRNAGTWRIVHAIGIDSDLGMQTIAVSGRIAIRCNMFAYAFFYDIHYSESELSCLIVHAEAFLLVFDTEKVIYAFGQTDNAEHSGKVFQFDKPFPDQEVCLEET